LHVSVSQSLVVFATQKAHFDLIGVNAFIMILECWHQHWSKFILKLCIKVVPTHFDDSSIFMAEVVSLVN